MKASIFSGAVAAGLAFAGLASAADTEDWKTRSIYQVMIDRFARTDGSDTECKDLQQFCGGSWKGLLNKLDYIQGEHLRTGFCNWPRTWSLTAPSPPCRYGFQCPPDQPHHQEHR